MPPAAKRKPVKRSHVLPGGADFDSPAAWGDGDDSNDARLLRETPPHWS
jgi:hypothetical protein